MLLQALTETMNQSLPGVPLLEGLPELAPRLGPEEAAAIASAFIQSIAMKDSQESIVRWTEGLAAVLHRDEVSRSRNRWRGLTAALGLLSNPASALVAPVPLQPALEPLPPPLPAQTLVDLLKHPLCVGEARRLVLEQLGRHYHRSFADQWEFVEYARQQNLNLDLTTSPKRPEALDSGK
jgi:hypothetical protein